MKYIVAVVLTIIISLLVSPIMLITWSKDGYDDILDGIGKICGIDEECGWVGGDDGGNTEDMWYDWD